MNRRLVIRIVGLMVLAAPCAAWGARDPGCVPRGAYHRSTLVIVNYTSCPVDIFIDHRFLVRCEPLAKQTIRTDLSGEVHLSGRSRCDAWGPVKKRLAPGRTTVWRLGASNRQRR